MEAFSLFKNYIGDTPTAVQQRWAAAESLYHAGVRSSVRSASSFFGKSVYRNIPSQAETLGELRDTVSAGGGNIMDVQVVRRNSQEYLVKMAARFSVAPVFYSQCFKNPVSINEVGIVTVNFYMGLCTEMVDLIKSNGLIESSLEQWKPEETFDANKVLPVLIQRSGVIKMNSISEVKDQALKLQWFQLRTGQIFGVEIDGYSVVNANHISGKERKPVHRLQGVGGKKATSKG